MAQTRKAQTGRHPDRKTPRQEDNQTGRAPNRKDRDKKGPIHEGPKKSAEGAVLVDSPRVLYTHLGLFFQTTPRK